MFITFEGGEGAGKTTQIARLARALADRGRTCLTTREPGGTPLGQRIRALLLDPQSDGISPRAELLLYMADRAEHIAAVIAPALKRGEVVLCDRFFDATVVYQGIGRGLTADRVRELHGTLFGGLVPDVTILLDLPPAVGLSRAARQLAAGGRSAAEGRFESEALAFHERVRDGYLALARREPGRFRVIDAAQSEAAVAAAVLAAVEAALKAAA
jgi:dTMP kinase